MKKTNLKLIINFYLLIILLSSCNKSENNFLRLKVNVTNSNSDLLVITSKDYSKTLHSKSKFNFDDTLSITSGLYNLSDGKNYTQIYLENGYDITIKFDGKSIDSTLFAEGKGAKINNFLFAKSIEFNYDYVSAVQEMDSTSYHSFIEEYKRTFKNEAGTFYSNETQKEVLEVYLNKNTRNLGANFKFGQSQKRMKQLIGTPFPNIEFETINGKIFKIKELEGKPTYIDLWATWCSPCIAEIPHLEKLFKVYSDKINFVSISIDEPKNHDKWKEFVSKHQIKGTQLILKPENTTKFFKAIFHSAIPRFILLDKNGIIIEPDAFRPSFGNKLNYQLDELLN